MKPINLLILLSLSLFTACAQCRANHAATPTNTGTNTDTLTRFSLPAIPRTLSTPEQRADYLIRHYWNNVNFADTNYAHRPDITEQAWVDYIDLLTLMPPRTADEALKSLFAQAEKEKVCYLYLMELADKYLYDAGSPMRNEERYIAVLDALIASPILNETEKICPQAQRELAEKNRPGTTATDFTYTLKSGRQGTLHALKAPFTLLFIHNPECSACIKVLEVLKQSPHIGRMVVEKKLKIVSFYPDKEPDKWERHLADYPKEWINGYDAGQAVKTQGIYDLRIIPTLYLLDNDKKVLLKNASVKEVELYISSNCPTLPE